VWLLNSFFLLASQTRVFWTVRALAGRVGFFSHRHVFGIRTRILETRTRTGTLLALARLTIGQVVLAIIVAMVLQKTDPYFDDFYKGLGLSITPDIYGTLLGTVTATGAVLIGLYYAATTAIGGVIYARVPNNIRDLLARDRVGNIYIRHLALLTYLGVILLGLRAAGFAPIKLAIPIFTVTSGIAIMAFVILGARAFNLFDPTSLSYDLFEQLRRNCSLMTPRGYRWLDPSFQHHAHIIANSAVDTLATLADITATEPHLSGQPFLALSEQLLSFLITYEPQKKRIPTGSRWYAQRYSHPDWYQTGDTETTLAHQMASGLRPKTIGDSRWIEAEILPITHKFIGVAWRHRKYESVINLLRYFDAYLKLLVKEGEVRSAFEVLESLTANCWDMFFAAPDDDEIEALGRIGVADALATIPTNMFLAYIEALSDKSRESVLLIVQNINWKSSRGIYVAGFPRHLLERLEWLQPRIRFEVATEGLQISPGWYVAELIFQQIAEITKVAINSFVQEVQAVYGGWISAADNKKLLWVGAAVLARELEYWSKIKFHNARLREYWTALGRDRRIEGLPWPVVDFDEIDQNRMRRERQIVGLMSTQSIALSTVRRPDSYPDFAGQFLHAAGEALFAATSDNDAETVTLLFPSFFQGSLLQFNRILQRASELDWRSDIAVKVAVAPVLDLADLSGYAILFSELYSDKTISELIIAEWSRYLGAPKDGASKSRTSFIAAAITLTDSAFELAHRSLIRTAWRQAVSQRLRQLERKPASRRGRGIFWDDTVVVHGSPIIRAYADVDPIMYDGIDLFVETCLRTRNDAKEFDFGRRHGRLGRELARANRASRGAKAENE
jgi:hypothetical protein